jgi:hypothetical protein
VWTDRGEQATYCPGEPIEIYFATNTDAYVTIYDIDTRGQVQVLFPAPYDNDNLVRGGRTYRVSQGWGTRLAVSGPQGREAIRAVAVAAHDRYEPHGRGYGNDGYNDGYDDYDGRYREDDRFNESWKGRQGVDPDDFDRELGKRVVPVPQGDRDVDQTGFYVASSQRCGGYGGGRRDGYGRGGFGIEIRGGWRN